MRMRIALLGALLSLGACAVVRRAWELQIEEGPELRRMAEEQYLRDIRLAPKRGTIYDRRGAELAVSVEVDSVWANPRELRRAGVGPQTAAAALARAIPGLDAAAVERRLGSDRYFVWIQRRITPQQARAVRDLGLPGVSMSREARRFYPNRELAAHVLGFADVDGVGIEGLERQFEERLRGSVAAVPAIRDRRGRVVFSDQLLDERAAQGDDLELTIDKTIQAVAERELALAVRTAEAKAGSVVVMDPRTGEILAIANYPTFNPNQPADAPVGSHRNRAITDRYEPGSTIKTFTVAGALAAGAVRPDEVIDCERGAMRVAEYTIHDSHPWERLSLAQILARSSNIGTAKIGQALGRQGLFRTLRRFGFGEPTGVPLPGETGGILRHYRRWYDMDAATIAFGQGMSATTMQLALAMGAIANGGKLMAPLLVRRVLDGRGQTLEEFPPRVRRQVVPQGTARLVADMLTAVTGPGGTGTEAAIDGYVVAGKTGTAQKADYVGGGYARDRWVGSFVGFVPADRPRLVIAVMIDEPVIEHYGGLVAGPVFRRIGEAALRHLGVPPTTGGEALAAREVTVASAQRVWGRREEAAAGGHRHADGVEDRGAAGLAGSVMDGGRGAAQGDDETIVPIDVREPGGGEVRVPDLTGRSARAAMQRLATLGLVGEIEGSGLVAAQTPAAGATTAKGGSVRLLLAPRPQPPDEPPGGAVGDLPPPRPRRRAGGAT
jgi:cell division protein FtsI (penicillin-binding protein 3)